MARWGRRILLVGLAGWALVLAGRCHLPRQAVAPSPDSTSAVYLVRHGWHAGLAVRRADLPAGAWPVLDSVSDARYLEVGWGEGHYYPGRTRGLWGVLRAGAWPTGSVLHVVPVRGSVPGRFPRQTVVRVPVSPAELRALTRYMAASFDTTRAGMAIPVADGYYAGSQFYQSGLPYHLFNNCNHWAAAALEAAGCRAVPRWTFTVGQVIERAQQCGTLVQRPSRQ